MENKKVEDGSATEGGKEGGEEEAAPGAANSELTAKPSTEATAEPVGKEAEEDAPVAMEP